MTLTDFHPLADLVSLLAHPFAETDAIQKANIPTVERLTVFFLALFPSLQGQGLGHLDRGAIVTRTCPAIRTSRKGHQ